MKIKAKLLQIQPLKSGVREDESVWKHIDCIVEFVDTDKTHQIYLRGWGDTAEHLSRLIPGLDYLFDVAFHVNSRPVNGTTYYSTEAKCLGVSNN